ASPLANPSLHDALPIWLSNAVAVSGGEAHSLALKSDGTVIGWGDNSQGQITIPSGLTNAAAIDAGRYHSLALRSNGTVVAWGGRSEEHTSELQSRFDLV